MLFMFFTVQATELMAKLKDSSQPWFEIRKENRAILLHYHIVPSRAKQPEFRNWSSYRFAEGQLKDMLKKLKSISW